MKIANNKTTLEAPQPNLDAMPRQAIQSQNEEHPGHTDFAQRAAEEKARPKRHPIIHWLAIIAAVFSIVPLVIWLFNQNQPLSLTWLWIDIGLTVFFCLEFVTRSGFRWDPASYTRSRFFDFIAIVPALVLVYYQVPLLLVWFWIILVARFGRVLDRILGDGFLSRNFFALVGGLEEEITDRVMLRIMDRIREDLERGSLLKGIADAVENNKNAMLEKIRTKHPQEGVIGTIARASGINSALSRAEESSFNTLIATLKSPELENVVRESIDHTFKNIEKEIAVKSWKQKLGIRNPQAKQASS